MLWYVLGVATILGVGLFHLVYWSVIILGAVQVLDSLKPQGKTPAGPEYTRPPTKDLELEANGHTVLFNRLMAKSVD